MKKLMSMVLSSVLFMGLLMSAAVQADAEKNAADAPVISADVKDGVVVNTGNEAVDDVANLAAKCAEKKLALEACPGGMKGVACRKGLEVGRFKGVDCPNL